MLGDKHRVKAKLILKHFRAADKRVIWPGSQVCFQQQLVNYCFRCFSLDASLVTIKNFSKDNENALKEVPCRSGVFMHRKFIIVRRIGSPRW